MDYSVADIVVGVDSQDIKSADDFLGYIEGKKAGDRIELAVVREGRRISVPVVLGGSERD